MNPAANPPEHSSQESGVRSQTRRRWVAGLLAAAAVGAGLVFAPSCKKPNTINKGEKGETTGDPWEAAARKLQTNTDLGSAKSALTALNHDLSVRGAEPPKLAPEAERAVVDALGLGPADVDELRTGTFTGLDGEYLFDCLYLRKAAESLDVKGGAPAHLPEAGFAWVCRQVYLNPWGIPTARGFLEASALPPTYVLRRGYGSGLERAYVFLAFLQQAGYDGCLVGPPTAADKPAGYVTLGPDGKPLPGFPRGPFWAVGVRVGADVLLFNPWKGTPFPGPDGKGVGTLAQIKANPAQVQKWLDDKAWGVSADEVKAATAFVTAPLSGQSSRMRVLDEKLRPTTGLRLEANAAALRERFHAPPPHGPGLPADAVKYWKPPPEDRFAFVRTLPEFLPAEEGGRDRGNPNLKGQFTRSMLPESVLAFGGIPNPRLREQLIGRVAGPYYEAFLKPPTPRELLQRGQFQEANRLLTGKQTEFVKAIERHEREGALNAEKLGGWFKQAFALYEELERAIRPNPLGPARPDTDPEVMQAKGQVDAFWRAEGPTVQVLIDRAAAEAGLAEASYLLALTKHEEAERAQARAERAGGPEAARAKADAAEAWREAANAWQSYEARARSLGGWPNRAEHARVLAARASALAP